MLFRAEWDRLLLDARGGDVLALERLLEAAGDDLHSAAAGVVRRRVQERLQIDEVYAESLLAVVKDFGSLRATNYIGFRYWFASIARNNVRRALRRERKRAEVLTDGEDAAAEHRNGARVHDFARESLYFVRHVLMRMPRSQQVAYVLREGLGLTWPSIGFVLERRGAAAARLVHYRAALRVRGSGEQRPSLRVPVIVA